MSTRRKPKNPGAEREKNQLSRLELTSVILSGISLVVAIAAGVIAWQANQLAQAGARVAFYVELRKNNANVRERIDRKYLTDDSAAPDRLANPAQWDAIRDYWYSTFDEWYVTTRLYRETFQVLWRERYLYLVGASLEKPALRAVACAEIVKPPKPMPSSDASADAPRSPLLQEFAQELVVIYAGNRVRKPGDRLCST